jgi:DNA-binding transcriptional regulator of glucitol operon
MLYGVSGAILAWLFSAFGKSPEQPMGVILVGPVAAAFCLASTLLFFRYPEEETLEAVIALEAASGKSGHAGAEPE